MRIIVWGINYAPELTGIAPYNVALCEALRELGHDVEMVTTFPYYPSWRKRKQDRESIYRTEMVDRVLVHRCWHFVPERVTPSHRVLHEASFVLSSTLRTFFLPRPDVYVVISPPLLLGAAAWLVQKFKRAPFIFHVQDLQPDAAVGLGMLRSGLFTRALYAIESLAYRKAARVSGISEGMLEVFGRKGVPADKLVFFPNGVALPDEKDFPPRGNFRRRHQFTDNEFLAVYSGNLGVKQGLSVLIDAAPLLQDAGIRIVICGDGAERESLFRQIEARGANGVTMLPLLSHREYAEMLIDADVCLVTQQIGSGNAFFPSKLLTTLAYGKPVVTVADPESALARAVATGQFGINIPPGNPAQLATALRDLAHNRFQLGNFAVAGCAFVQQFEQNHVLAKFFSELEKVARPAP